MSVEESLGSHHQMFCVCGILRHPRFAGRKPSIGGVADADEAEPLGLLKRGQA